MQLWWYLLACCCPFIWTSGICSKLDRQVSYWCDWPACQMDESYTIIQTSQSHAAWPAEGSQWWNPNQTNWAVLQSSLYTPTGGRKQVNRETSLQTDENWRLEACAAYTLSDSSETEYEFENTVHDNILDLAKTA